MAQDAVTFVIACECGQKMKVPTEAVGKTAACVKCGKKVKITEKHLKQPASKSKRANKSPAKRRNGASSTPGNGNSIVDTLLENGIVNDDGVEEARIVRQDIPRSEWETLIEIGRVSPEGFYDLMSKQEGMTNIDLKNYSIPGDVLDFIPGDLVRKGRLFPVDKLGKLLTVAMACPIDTNTIKEVESATGLKIRIMLCDLDDLRQSIRTYFPEKHEQVAYDDTLSKDLAKEFNELLEMNPVARKAFNLDPLAPFKISVDHALQAHAQGEDAVPQLIKIIRRDPTCAAMVLSPANSAAYGFPKRVDNLDMAIAVLGADAVCRILKFIEPIDYTALDDGFDFKGFWARSQFCALAAHAIATKMESQRIQTAYTAGLLHAIGRLGMHKILSHSYTVVTNGLSGADLFAAENRVYHLTHTEVGYMLARKWNLPAGLTLPIRYHRNPFEATKSKEVVSIVALASIMTDSYEQGGQPKLDDQGDLLEALVMTKAKAVMIYRGLTEKKN